MALIPGLSVLFEKVPELSRTRGFLRATVTVLGIAALALWGLVMAERQSAFAALALQLVIYGATYWLIRQAVFGRRQRRSYAQSFFSRLLPAAGLNLASLFYILAADWALLSAGNVTAIERLIPRLPGGVLAFYLILTGLLLLVRMIQTAGVDTLGLVYNYFPNEGRQLTDSIYGLLRHPAYAGIDRLALAFGLWTGSAYAMLLAVLFVFVWHPLWYALEEQELVERFGDAYRDYMDRVPAVFPPSLPAELALLEAATRRWAPTDHEPPTARPGGSPSAPDAPDAPDGNA